MEIASRKLASQGLATFNPILRGSLEHMVPAANVDVACLLIFERMKYSLDDVAIRLEQPLCKFPV